MNAAAVRAVTFLLVATGVVSSSVLILLGPAAAFTYVGRSPIAGAAAIGASAIALLSGLAVAVLEPRWLSSRLLAVAAVLWVSPAWSGWQQFPPGAATVAAAVSLLTPAVMVHLAAGFASGSPARGRRLVISTYVVGGCAACIRAFAADPFTDVVCWADCRANPFAVIAAPWAEGGATTLAAGSGSIALCVIVPRSGTQPDGPARVGADGDGGHRSPRRRVRRRGRGGRAFPRRPDAAAPRRFPHRALHWAGSCSRWRTQRRRARWRPGSGGSVLWARVRIQPCSTRFSRPRFGILQRGSCTEWARPTRTPPDLPWNRAPWHRPSG